ncbi:MAG: S8 family serine peptidase [Caldilineaceae bacterium]|nr:S8 family serine peptidase [Caldilineaceae bacterium]
MSSSRVMQAIALVAILSLLLSPIAYADIKPPASSDGPPANPATPSSPRLIVELDSPPLAVAYLSEVSAAAVNGKLDASSTAAQAYVNQLRAEQATFVSTMRTALADATVATFVNEAGVTEEATYQVVFNGLAVNPGATPREKALQTLVRMPGVKNVYYDTPHYTQLYTSTTLINAPVVWNTVGGRANAGAGIKVASMDGGVHHLAPMMNGSGYSYPPGYGPNGLGLTANNNGKIIASRAYFRSWDPPAPGDENPWPGVAGTSHGMHTASTAAGDIVTATYNGLNLGQISGVAPKAYVMSYRVFYESVNGIGSFYTTEGIAALEDIVQDGADVINNSWGGGPGSVGGLFDPLDQALINATKAGIFVSMSNGNAGPNPGTGDHPSADYINVAASTSGGALASGVMNVTQPEPTDPNLQMLPYGTADFGPALPLGQTTPYSITWAGAVDAGNIQGCAAFPANAFAGTAALISRGVCSFSDKVYNAQQAGATFVVIYDNADNIVQGMSCATHCGPGELTIASIRIPKASGDAVVAWVQTHGAASAIEVSTVAFQQGNTPDQIIGFSSRGPGVGGTLKPDIAAPGVNIIAQGYAEGVTGEARHLGYGQASGTSMASPHVAGAAAMLKQIHPTWSVAAIKSALMSTAKYMDIYLADGVTPAQPLDMGAGRLDLTNAANPGVILDPPSLSFGFVPTGTQKTITVTLTSVAAAAETYALDTLYTGDGFAPTQTTALPGVTANVAAVTLNPGESKQIQVTFDPATGSGIGDNQGYVILDGATHDAHLAAWARVIPAVPVADVLVIDGDFSTLGAAFGFPLPDYRWYYTNALAQLGYTYTVLDYDLVDLPDAATLSGYRAILYFTGDNYVNGAGLTNSSMDKLVEYTNAGGSVIVMGQDMAATIDHDVTDPGNPHFFYQARLGANWIQDSISDNETPTSFIVADESAPAFLADVVVDLTQPRQLVASGALSGTQEVPPVSTLTKGSFSLFHDIDSNYTEFAVTVVPSTTQPITLTLMQIYTGAAGTDGPAIRDLAALGGLTLPKVVTSTLQVSGVISPSFTMTEVQAILDEGLYVNVHTTANPGGEIRGQIEPIALENQPYVDEIDNHYHDGSEDPTGIDGFASKPILTYAGPFNLYNGTVAMGYRQQPSLENAGITYSGRTVYATFGLEGMSNSFNPTLAFTPTTRSELLGAFLDWTWAPAPTTVEITDTVAMSSSLHIFSAQHAYGLQARSATVFTPMPVQYRWDFGDGSAYVTSQGAEASHQYLCADTNTYTVRVEITDNYGNVVIGSKTIDVTTSCTTNVGPAKVLYLPIIAR